MGDIAFFVLAYACALFTGVWIGRKTMKLPTNFHKPSSENIVALVREKK